MEAIDAYTVLEELGRGSYGVVFKAQHKATGYTVAIKQLKDDQSEQNEHMRKTALREAKILKQLQHPNVVRLLELFRSKTKLYMVFEFVDRSILRLLESHARGLPAMEVKKIMWQLVLALQFLHGQQIIHRDLKPENILIDDSGTVKLADFGFARPQATPGGAPGHLSPYVATRWYRPPELLVGDTYGPAVDIWALGCILIELSTGQPLFPGKTSMDQLWLILRCTGCSSRQLSRMHTVPALKGIKMPMEEELMPLEKRFHQLDRSTMALLKACLSPEPSKRPNCAQLLTHEYFAVAKQVLAPYTEAAARAASGTPPPNPIAVPYGSPAAMAAANRLSTPPTGAGDWGEELQGQRTSRPVGIPQHPQHPGDGHQAGVGGFDGGGGGGGEGEDCDGVRVVTGSDDGGAEDKEEKEEGGEEEMSPEKRAKIMKWMDGIPEQIHEKARQIAREMYGPGSGYAPPSGQASTISHNIVTPGGYGSVTPSPPQQHEQQPVVPHVGLTAMEQAAQLAAMGLADRKTPDRGTPDAFAVALQQLQEQMKQEQQHWQQQVGTGLNTAATTTADAAATQSNTLQRVPSARNVLALQPGSLSAEPPGITAVLAANKSRGPGILSKEGSDAAAGDFEKLVMQLGRRASGNDVERTSLVRNSNPGHLQMRPTQMSMDGAAAPKDQLKLLVPGASSAPAAGSPASPSTPTATPKLAVHSSAQAQPQPGVEQPATSASPLKQLLLKQQAAAAGSPPASAASTPAAAAPAPATAPSIKPAAVAPAAAGKSATTTVAAGTTAKPATAAAVTPAGVPAPPSVTQTAKASAKPSTPSTATKPSTPTFAPPTPKAAALPAAATSPAAAPAAAAPAAVTGTAAAAAPATAGRREGLLAAKPAASTPAPATKPASSPAAAPAPAAAAAAAAPGSLQAAPVTAAAQAGSPLQQLIARHQTMKGTAAAPAGIADGLTVLQHLAQKGAVKGK